MSLRFLLLAATALLSLAQAHAQDAAAGGAAFQECADCHSPTGSDGVGPGLKGIYGRRTGTKAGFIYSPAMKKSELVWDDTALDNFLASPNNALPGTAMAWPGEEDPKVRADLIAYLKTLK